MVFVQHGQNVLFLIALLIQHTRSEGLNGVFSEPYRHAEERPCEVLYHIAAGVAYVDTRQFVQILGEGWELFDEVQNLRYIII